MQSLPPPCSIQFRLNLPACAPYLNLSAMVSTLSPRSHCPRKSSPLGGVLPLPPVLPPVSASGPLVGSSLGSVPPEPPPVSVPSVGRALADGTATTGSCPPSPLPTAR